MLKVGVYGGSGYTGQELLRLLIRHPDAEVVATTSRRFKGMAVSDVYPVFEGMTSLKFVDARPEEMVGAADIVFSALPHGAAMKIVPVFIKAGQRVIDLSADYRLHDSSRYERTYQKHASPELLKEAVYGLPEIHRAEVERAQLVANPGCYPTSVILGLAPALKADLLDVESIIIDSKSGVSGAGREPKTGSLFCEVNEGFKAYNVLKHRHSPEMEQELSLMAGLDVHISFVPHLLPVNRGILSTMYATFRKDISTPDLIDIYREFYRGEYFVRVCKEGVFPNVSSVKGTNHCDVGLCVDKRSKRIVIVSVIDNLIKGASGQAIQNMNIMGGLKENTGLELVALFP
jgi:N-acetyl-gamma-glutamyl-phosphate reductase